VRTAQYDPTTQDIDLTNAKCAKCGRSLMEAAFAAVDRGKEPPVVFKDGAFYCSNQCAEATK
jgi:hypothetical protein